MGLDTPLKARPDPDRVLNAPDLFEHQMGPSDSPYFSCSKRESKKPRWPFSRRGVRRFGFVNCLFCIIKDYIYASETSPSLDFISMLTKKFGGLESCLICPSLTPELQIVIKEGGLCTVLDQPIPLYRSVIRSLDPLHISSYGESIGLAFQCLDDPSLTFAGYVSLCAEHFSKPQIRLVFGLRNAFLIQHENSDSV